MSKKPFSSRLIPIISVILITTSGCGGAAEIDNDAVVAQVGEEVLTVSELTSFMLRSPLQPDPQLASGLVSAWTDFAMLMTTLNSGVDLTADSILRAISNNEVVDRSITSFATDRGLAGNDPTPGQIDSLIRTDQVRAFRYHSFNVADASDSVREAKSGILFEIFSAVINGETMAAAIAAQPSAAVADLQSEIGPASNFEELPPELARVIWQLRDGEVARPMQGNGAVNLIERVPAAEARDAYAAWLQPKLRQQSDRRFTDSLAADLNIELVNDGLVRLRSALSEPVEVTGSEALVEWATGTVTPTEARDWISGMMPAERARLAAASETGIEQLGITMARREIFFDLARESAAVDTAAIRSEVMDEFRNLIPALWDGVAARVNEDGSRMGLASSWLSAVLTGERQYQRLPGTMGGWLRSRLVMEFDGQAMQSAGREASRLWIDPATQPQLPGIGS